MLILFDIAVFTFIAFDFALETSPLKRCNPFEATFLTCNKVSTNAGSTDKYIIIPTKEQIMYSGPKIVPIAVFKAIMQIREIYKLFFEQTVLFGKEHFYGKSYMP